MDNKTCYQCTKRASGCHANCSLYLKQQEKLKIIRKEKWKNNIVDAFRYECVTKTKNQLK